MLSYFQQKEKSMVQKGFRKFSGAKATTRLEGSGYRAQLE
jgi:hypothetical protein